MSSTVYVTEQELQVHLKKAQTELAALKEGLRDFKRTAFRDCLYAGVIVAYERDIQQLEEDERRFRLLLSEVGYYSPR